MEDIEHLHHPMEGLTVNRATNATTSDGCHQNFGSTATIYGPIWGNVRPQAD
jgi:hypothetical protein